MLLQIFTSIHVLISLVACSARLDESMLGQKGMIEKDRNG